MGLIDDAIAQALAANQPQAAPDPANTASSVLSSFNPAAAMGMAQAPVQTDPAAAFPDRPPGTGPDRASSMEAMAANPAAAFPDRPAGTGPDRASAEQDTTGQPTADLTTGTAGYGATDPTTYTPPKQPTSVADATSQADDQMAAAAASRARADQAKLDATKAYQTRMADASQKAADDMGVLNNAYNNEQAAISAKGDSDTATWLQDLKDQATREPNPSRWWNHQGGLGRALWGLSMAFGALHSYSDPNGPNAALNMVQKEIDADIARQADEIKQSYAATHERGQTIRDQVQRRMDMARDRHTGAMTRLQSLERAWQARAAIPGDQDAAAAKAAAQSWFDDQKMNRTELYRTEKVQAASQEAARRFQAGQAAVQRKFEADQKVLDRTFHDQQRQATEAAAIAMEDQQFAHKLALSPVEVTTGQGVGAPGKAPGVKKDGEPAALALADRPQPDGGSQVVLADAKGNKIGDGIVKFAGPGAAERFDKANGAIMASDKMYNDAIKLRDRLKENSKLGTFAGGIVDPETEQMVTELGMSIAQAQNGHRISDKDYDLGVRQAVGFNPDGSMLQRGKFALGQDKVIQMLNTAITNHHVMVEAQLQQYNDIGANGQGSRILYRPTDLSAPDVQQKNAREVEGRAPVSAAETDLGGGKVAPVTGVADYEKRVAQEGADTGNLRGSLLPPHDRPAVESVIESAKFRGPATVRAKAAEVLDKLAAEDKQLTKTMNAVDDPWNTSPPSHDEAVAAYQRSRVVHETQAIVKAVADDLAKKQAAKVERFKNRADLFGAKFSTETLKKMARDEGVSDASEVAAIIAKFQN